MTRFQRINLWLGLAALALVGCMAISQVVGTDDLSEAVQESLIAAQGATKWQF